MKKLMLNKRGVLGLNTAIAFILALLSLVIIAFATIIVLNTLNDTSVATNATTQMARNVSAGINSLFANAGTWFALIGIVIIILIIAIVIVTVRGFEGSGQRGL